MDNVKQYTGAKKYYQLLFAGTSGRELIRQVTSYRLQVSVFEAETELGSEIDT
jgi:hypothetical protein